MGSLDNSGIILRLCNALFDRIQRFAHEDPCLTCKVEVHDFPESRQYKQSLKVQEHSALGPYVGCLAQLAVATHEDIEAFMAEENKSRTVAATSMNYESSPSQTVFNVILSQTYPDADITREKGSKMSIVDLVESNRVSKTGAVSDRLKNGSNINKSLTTLALVISKLADQTTLKDKFVPCRDSVLTWLLKENFAENSRLAMVQYTYGTLQYYRHPTTAKKLLTLRFADCVKFIVCHAAHASVNNKRIIRDLRSKFEFLKVQLKHAVYRDDLSEQLHQLEKSMSAMSETWGEKLVKTERVHQEQQQALEKIRISVQASGILVEKNKFYFVIPHADPSLNGLLVYYLKERTCCAMVRRNNAVSQPDVQLSGLGIQSGHRQLLIENGQLIMKPLGNVPCFPDGSPVASRVLFIKHGDSLLWSNNQFFRVSCPKPSLTGEEYLPDFNLVWKELLLKRMSNDPMRTTIARLENQHEENKQRALQRNNQESECHLPLLRSSMLPPSSSFSSSLDFTNRSFQSGSGNSGSSQSECWAHEKDDTFRRTLAQLREGIVRANALAREVNDLAGELGKQTQFSVTFQIPPANLSPNRKRVGLVIEPAILDRRTSKPNQNWSFDILDVKLVDWREFYNEITNADHLNRIENPFISPELDQFYEIQESHNVVGVANMYLDVLLNDARLSFYVPIISQQAEAVGKLPVELKRIAGQLPVDGMYETSSVINWEEQDEDGPPSSTITCHVALHQICGLPASWSHFVFCQYNIFGQTESPPIMSYENEDRRYQKDVRLAHMRDFTILCTEGELSVEAWGRRRIGFLAPS